MDVIRVLVFFLAGVIISTESRRRKRFPGDVECPRKPELTHDRKCLKKCHTDLDCRSRTKKCMCDDVCGKSCVKPARLCENLKAVFNGKVEMIPYNTFGARARYTCSEGYILSGVPERVCQGDGYWSEQAPTCETEVPILQRNQGMCRDPPDVPHATRDGPVGQEVFPLGTQLTYSCASGYNIDGFFKAMCVGEGRWVGASMTCSPRNCGHPGDIRFGRREGNVFAYPSRVTYVCNEGYELIGRNYRSCGANGEWSGTLPMCRAVRCPKPPNLANGQVHGDKYTYGSFVHFSCTRGFTLVGTTTRRCLHDGTWSGEGATCAMVDCGLPGPFPNGEILGQHTTFGAEMIFRCRPHTSYQGLANRTRCLEDGRWSQPVPRCWLQCELPRIQHGFLRMKDKDAGDHVEHGSQLQYNCTGTGYHQEASRLPRCHNGTWDILPQCKPAPCSLRPPDVNKALVRYLDTHHGAKAKYACTTGYKLHGDTYLTCNYGVWRGTQPSCKPLYCEYPGTIENGQVLIVGSIGKYEYRPYVEGLGQNEQIEFICHKNYKRVGHKGATCVDGGWSPRGKPSCVAGKHPRLLYIFRGKRDVTSSARRYVSVEDEWTPQDFCTVPVLHFGRIETYRPQTSVPPGTTLWMTCDPGYHLEVPTGAHKQRPVCRQGAWSVMAQCLPYKRLRRTSETCRPPLSVPRRVTHVVSIKGRHQLRAKERHLSHGTELQFTCDHPYVLHGAPSVACNNGEWSPPVDAICTMDTERYVSERGYAKPDAEKGFCEVPKVNHSIDVQPAPGFFVAHHTAILVRCESGYILYDATEPLCQDGVWSHTPQCIREKYGD